MKLKTIEDMDVYKEPFGPGEISPAEEAKVNLVIDLRAEVIKHIKHHKKLLAKAIKDKINNQVTGHGAIVHKLMELFNITEEDLQ